MNRLLVAILFVFCCGFLLAQTPDLDSLKKDLMSIHSSMENMENFHAVSEVVVSGGAANIVHTSEIKKKGLKVWVKTEGIEYQFTPDYVLLINENEKLITYSKGIGEKDYKEVLGRSGVVPNIDTLLNVIDSVHFSKDDKGNRKYQLFFSHPLFNSITFVLRPDLTYSSLEYSYSSDLVSETGYNAVTITFPVWNTGKAIPDEIFTINEYLVKTENGLSLRPKYASFHFLNLDDNEN
jgi:hypothetical protein